MKIATYTLKELSGMYFPLNSSQSATTQLRRWIRMNKALMEALEETGYTRKHKWLTPRQVSLIVQHLGEP